MTKIQKHNAMSYDLATTKDVETIENGRKLHSTVLVSRAYRAASDPLQQGQEYD